MKMTFFSFFFTAYQELRLMESTISEFFKGFFLHFNISKPPKMKG